MKINIPPTALPLHHNSQIALETSGLTGSIAVLRGEAVLREIRLPTGQRTAATLAPALADTREWCSKRGIVPDFISIADGPGSFTGLRIGVTTAKTLSYGCDLPLIAVDSVAAIAATTFVQEPQANRLLVGTNAYRGQVFTAILERSWLLTKLDQSTDLTGRLAPESWDPHPNQVRIVDRERWLEMLSSLPEGVLVTGDSVVFSQVAELPFVQRTRADAVGVGLLAVRAAAQGRFTDPLHLVPRYLRASAAEEQRAAAEKA